MLYDTCPICNTKCAAVDPASIHVARLCVRGMEMPLSVEAGHPSMHMTDGGEYSPVHIYDI